MPDSNYNNHSDLADDGSREVFIGSWLQVKEVRALTKRVRYLPEHWFVLCVHNERLPHLEWYLSDKDVVGHSPVRVVDLLSCKYVQPSIDDNRAFVIGFSHANTPPIELAALTEPERQGWVDMLNCKLRQLDCLEKGQNLYATFPSGSVNRRPHTRNSESIDDLLANVTTPTELAPPLPPMNLPQRISPFYNTEGVAGVQDVVNSNHNVDHYEHMNSITTTTLNMAATSSTTVPKRSPPPPPPKPKVKQQKVTTPTYTAIDKSPPMIPIKAFDTCVHAEMNGSSSQAAESNKVVMNEVSSSENQSLTNTKSRESNVSSGSSNMSAPSIRQSVYSPAPSTIRLSDPFGMNQLYRESIGTDIARHIDNKLNITNDSIYDDLIDPYDTLEGVRPLVANTQCTDLAKNHNVIVESAETNIMRESVYQPENRQIDTNDEQQDTDNNIYDTPRRKAVLVLPSRPILEPDQSIDPSTSAIKNTQFKTPIAQQSSEFKLHDKLRLSASKSIKLPERTSGEDQTANNTAGNGEQSPYQNLDALIDHRNFSRHNSVGPKSPPVGISLTLRERQAIELGRDMRAGEITVQMPFADLNMGTGPPALTMIEWIGYLWVAGWTQKGYRKMFKHFHIGDRIQSVNGKQVRTKTELMNIYEQYAYNNELTMTLIVNRLPDGRVYSLRRTDEAESFGIVLDKKSCTISRIAKQSPACSANMSTMSDTHKPWVITEINGRPVSLFAKADETELRLKAMGLDMNIVVLPLDLVTAVKKELKRAKDWKLYSLLEL